MMRHLPLTSHVIVRAFLFCYGSSAECTRPMNGFIICTAPLRRVLMPNVLVQGPTLSTKLLQFLLHDDVRPTVTMLFPVRVSFTFMGSFETPDDEVFQDVLDTLRMISPRRLPHLETLIIEEDRRALLSISSQAQRMQFVAALPSPPSLMHLHLDFSTLFGGDDLRFISNTMPNLQELTCGVSVQDGGFAALFFSPAPAPAPASEHDALVPLSHTQALFPRLRSLTVAAGALTPAETRGFYRRVFGSKVVQQLKKLQFGFVWSHHHGDDDTSGLAEQDEDDCSTLSLEPLRNLWKIGGLFRNSKFLTAPDFSQLRCYEVDFFCRGAKFDYGHDVAIDLSQMTDLRVIGRLAFMCATGVSTVLPPPFVERIGHSFCYGSSITELDLAPLKSLEFVDTILFLCSCRRLSSFDTTPLLGKIGARVCTSFLRDCTALVEVDLSGLAGVTEIGEYFLDSCTALKKVTGCEALSQVRRVGLYFLYGTRSLEEFGFSKLTSLVEVGEPCLYGSGLEVTGRPVLNGIMSRNEQAMLRARRARE